MKDPMAYMYCERSNGLNVTSIRIFSKSTNLFNYLENQRQARYTDALRRLGESKALQRAQWAIDREQTVVNQLTSLPNFIRYWISSYSKPIYELPIDSTDNVSPRKLKPEEVTALLETFQQSTLPSEDF